MYVNPAPGVLKGHFPEHHHNVGDVRCSIDNVGEMSVSSFLSDLRSLVPVPLVSTPGQFEINVLSTVRRYQTMDVCCTPFSKKRYNKCSNRVYVSSLELGITYGSLVGNLLLIFFSLSRTSTCALYPGVVSWILTVVFF